MFSIRHKITTSGSSFTGAYHFRHTIFKTFISIHNKHLIALKPPFTVIALKNKFTPVRTPISICIISSKGYLSYNLKIFFFSCNYYIIIASFFKFFCIEYVVKAHIYIMLLVIFGKIFKMRTILILVLSVFVLASCSSRNFPQVAMFQDNSVLAHDNLQGRKVGTEYEK